MTEITTQKGIEMGIPCISCGGSRVGPGCHYGEDMRLVFELCQECGGKGYHPLSSMASCEPKTGMDTKAVEP